MEEVGFWAIIGMFVGYSLLIFAVLVIVAFLWLCIKEVILHAPSKGTRGTSTPDDDIVLDTEINRAATMLAEHKAAAQRKEQGK